jgi:DNA (cytosine-5)-methyltransferase 1
MGDRQEVQFRFVATAFNYMADINIKYYKADDLIMAEYNPRQLTKDQHSQLKDSLTRFGLVDPLIVNKHKDRKNILVGGHQRLKIAKEMGMNKIPCVEVSLPLDQEKELNIRLNKNVGEWDYDSLANYFDVGELMEWGFSDDDLQFYEEEIEEIIPENIDKDIGDIKILNLYAGIGGNRKLWGDLDITAVEYNPEIAEVYKDHFPNDKLIIADAHRYLEEHFLKYDFIWSSPPCPSHSRMRKQIAVGSGSKPIYPDMKLYEEILLLQGYFEGKWIVENVKSWYDPLIEPKELGRHYYWSNFDITKKSFPENNEIGAIDKFDIQKHQKKFGYNLDKYKFSSNYPKDKILRNMVHPKAGEYILKQAYKKAERIEAANA